jgi:hypothetical protein
MWLFRIGFVVGLIVLCCLNVEAVVMEFGLDIKGGAAVRERLKVDLEIVKTAVGDSKLDESSRKQLEERIDSISKQIPLVSDKLPVDFRTIMPFNDIQRQIYALNAPVLRAKGFAPLTAWAYDRWDPLFPMQSPEKAPGSVKLNVNMMRNEYRSEAFCLINSTDQAINAHLDLRGFPGGEEPAWISVREVQFTDTYIHYPIAAALPDAKRVSDGYEIDIPAGVTRQVWLVFHSKDIKAGVHKGQVVVSADGIKPIKIGLNIHIYDFIMPTESQLAIGGWDYTDGDTSAFDAKLVDQKDFIRFMQDNGVNTPWAGSILFKGCEFDAEGRMTVGPDFKVLDKWIKKWKDAKNYALFLGVGNNLNGEQMGTPRFNRMVGEWASAVMLHVRGKGIKPEQLFLLLVDEPDKPEQIETTIAWAKAIKATEPDVIIWSDPAFEDITKADLRFFEVVDVFCPLITRFVGSPQNYRDLFVNQQKAGRELMFYACVNGKHLDPISYHRAQFWLALRYGAKGSLYWAFGDEGGAPSSFNAYSSPGHMFSPLFIDAKLGIVDGKHMQAIREGSEDYSYFQILRARVDSLEKLGVESSVLKSAKKLLIEGPERVSQDITVPNISWWIPKDRNTMDKVRLDVLMMLEKLRVSCEM